MKVYVYRLIVFFILTTIIAGSTLGDADVARAQGDRGGNTVLFLPSVTGPNVGVGAAGEESDEAAFAHVKSHGGLPEHGGTSYAELSALWWQFTSVQSVENNRQVLAEAGTVDCKGGQTGSIWFLFGTDGSAATDEDGRTYRACAKPIPAGKALFFPVLNGVFLNGPGESYSVLEKRQILDEEFIPLACNLHSSIDGVPTVFSGIGTVRTQSGPFNYKVLLPGAEETDPPILVEDDETISDGYWVMFRPEKGAHEIRIQGSYCDPETGDPFFSVDVTYELTVR